MGVHWDDAECETPTLSHINLEAVRTPGNNHVRKDVHSPGVTVARIDFGYALGRVRVQLGLDELPCFGCRLGGDLELLSNAAELVLAQVRQELSHDLAGIRLKQAALFQVSDLDEQAFAQISRPDADRLLCLQHAQNR